MDEYTEAEVTEATEEESTVTAGAACTDCGGDKYKDGRIDRAEVARRNEIMAEIRSLWESGASEAQIRERFSGETNQYMNIPAYITLFWRKYGIK